MEWALISTKEDGVKLAYGAPNSDNVVVMLTCRPRSGEVQIWLTIANAADSAGVLLNSGERTARLTAHRSEDSYETFHAAAPANDAVFTGFANTGTLGFAIDGRRTTLPETRAYAQKFVATCRT
jgi:hypothetical protein